MKRRSTKGALLAALLVLSANAVGCRGSTRAGAEPASLGQSAGGGGAVEQADALLTRLAEYGYGGAVALGDQSGVWYAEGYGLRDRERQLPFTEATAIDIGSLTKVFTSALVLRLVDQGLLSVHDSLGALIPDAPADKAGITVHQLLTHTSGLLRSAVRLGVDEATEREAFIAAVMGSELLYPPGTRFEYSDTGYDLLAALVEMVTGESYATALRTRVLEPAGLTRTGFADAEVDGRPVAASYSAPLGSPWYDNREGPSPATWYNRGSGGLISDVGELQQLVRALRGGGLLRGSTWTRMTSPHVQVADELAYGYGWYVRGDPPHTLFHGGDIAGYKAHLEIDLASGRVLVALDNVLGWERVTDRHVVAALDGAGPKLPPPVDAGADGAGLEGTYRNEDGVTLVVWREAGQLGVEARGQSAVDVLFGVVDAQLRTRTGDAEAVMRALAADDTSFLTTRVRDRDRIAGMPQRLLAIWDRLVQLRGPVAGVEVAGSYPGQDGTVISFVDVMRESGPDPLRLIWRGDRLVAVGGSEGLRAPTATLTVVDGRRAARFEPSSGQTTVLERRGDRIVMTLGDRTLSAVRDTLNPIGPPTRSLSRALVPVFLREGPTSGLARLRSLGATRPDDFEFGEDALNRLGYRLLERDAVEAAIAVFRHTVEAYPESWNAYDSLGEAYLAADDTASAREAYAESLRLNPENETARRVLDTTGG